MNATAKELHVSTDVVSVRVDAPQVLHRALFVLLGFEVAMVIADATLNYMGWLPHGALRRFFNMTREDALGSFVAVSQTLMVGATLWVIAWLDSARRPDARTTGWVILAAFFTYLAIDDGTMLHERVGTAIADGAFAGGEAMTFFPSYGWQVAFVPFFGAMGLYIAWFVWTEFDDTSSKALVAGAVGLMATAIVMDFFEGLDKDHAFNIYAALGGLEGIDALCESQFNESGYTSMVHFSKSIEECIEMMAMTLMWFVFARHLVRIAPRIHLDLRPGEA